MIAYLIDEKKNIRIAKIDSPVPKEVKIQMNDWPVYFPRDAKSEDPFSLGIFCLETVTDIAVYRQKGVI